MYKYSFVTAAANDSIESACHKGLCFFYVLTGETLVVNILIRDFSF